MHFHVNLINMMSVNSGSVKVWMEKNLKYCILIFKTQKCLNLL